MPIIKEKVSKEDTRQMILVSKLIPEEIKTILFTNLEYYDESKLKKISEILKKDAENTKKLILLKKISFWQNIGKNLKVAKRRCRNKLIEVREKKHEEAESMELENIEQLLK